MEAVLGAGAEVLGTVVLLAMLLLLVIAADGRGVTFFILQIFRCRRFVDFDGRQIKLNARLISLINTVVDVLFAAGILSTAPDLRKVIAVGSDAYGVARARRHRLIQKYAWSRRHRVGHGQHELLASLQRRLLRSRSLLLVGATLLLLATITAGEHQFVFLQRLRLALLHLLANIFCALFAFPLFRNLWNRF